jgi:hypothetical protein
MAVNMTQTVNGLSTTTLNIPTTDFYTVSGTLELPKTGPVATQGPGGGAGTGAGGTVGGTGQMVPSQVVVTVNHNGTPIYTGAAGAKGFITGAACTAGDTLTVVLTSSENSTQADPQLNAVKCTIVLIEGFNLGEA